MLYIVVICLIAFLLYRSQSSSRVSELERNVQELKKLLEQPSNKAVPPQAHEPMLVPTPAEIAQSGYVTPIVAQQTFVPQSLKAQSIPIPMQNTEPDAASQFVDWLKQDFFMKLGAFLLLAAFGWFVSYAFMEGWIGEEGRITLGLIAGAAILAFGGWRIRSYEHQGAILIVLGQAVVLLTMTAGRELYSMFDPISTLGVILLTIVFVTFVSLRYDRKKLALANIIVAAIAPYFATLPTIGVGWHFAYLFVIVLGTLWVVYVTKWRELTFAALIIVALEAMPYLAHVDNQIALLWVFVFVAVFFVTNLVSIVRVFGEALSPAHLYTAVGTALLLIVWIFGAAPEEFQSLLFIVWMLVFSLGAYLTFKITNDRAPFYVYGGTSVVLLAAATQAELSGSALTIAYTLEIAVLVGLGLYFRLPRNVVNTLTLLFFIPGMATLQNISSSNWNNGVLHEDFFTLAIFGLVLAVTGVAIHEYETRNGGMENVTAQALITLGGVYGLILTWLIPHALFADDTAIMVALVTYTIIGLGMYVQPPEHKTMRSVGAALIGLVVARLLFVDVWAMEIFERIVTFFMIGVLLMMTAFLRKGEHK